MIDISILRPYSVSAYCASERLVAANSSVRILGAFRVRLHFRTIGFAATTTVLLALRRSRSIERDPIHGNKQLAVWPGTSLVNRLRARFLWKKHLRVWAPEI